MPFHARAIFFDPLVGFLSTPLARHVAIHDERVERFRKQTSLHILTGPSGHNRGSCAGKYIACKFKYSFFFLDQQNAAVGGALVLTGSRLGQFGFDLVRGHRWQPNLDDCPTTGSVVGRGVAAMFFYDAVADAQPEAGPFPNALRGVEGIEDALGILDSGAVVGALRGNVSTFATDTHPEFAGMTSFENGIDGIVDDIQKHLLDLVRVGDNHCRFGGKIALNADVIDLEVVVAQGQSFVENLADIDLISLRLPLAREREKVLDYTVRPLRLLEQFADVILCAVVQTF